MLSFKVVNFLRKLLLFFVLFYYFSLMLYSAHRLMEHGHLVLRHTVPINTLLFSLSDEFWRLVVLRCLVTERGNENIRYFISSSENRTYNLSRLQSHVCAPVPSGIQMPVVVYLQNYLLKNLHKQNYLKKS